MRSNIIFVKRWPLQQECIPVGCIPPARYRTGGLCPRGSLSRGVSVQVGSCPGGLPDRDLPVNRMTHRCKNITFPQHRFRAVNILICP